MTINGTQPTNGGVAHADTLETAPDPETAAETEADSGPVDPPKRTRRRRISKDTPAAAPAELTETQLAALGKLTIEAAKAGCTIDEYADTRLVPMAEAYAAWKAVAGG